MSVIVEKLKGESVLGVCGNRSTGKTHTILSELINIKREYPKLPIYVFGINESLHGVLEANNIHILRNKTDILDLRLKDCLVFVDEIGLFFESKGSSKQGKKLMRFFDRIEHNNCKFIVGTAREGYFNKFMCSRVQTFLVKEIEYDALVQGTWLNDKVKGIESVSDYRMVCPKDTFYIVSNRCGLTSKHSSQYTEALDSKKDNIDLFEKYDQISSKDSERNAQEIDQISTGNKRGSNCDKKSERKSEHKFIKVIR